MVLFFENMIVGDLIEYFYYMFVSWMVVKDFSVFVEGVMIYNCVWFKDLVWIVVICEDYCVGVFVDFDYDVVDWINGCKI